MLNHFKALKQLCARGPANRLEGDSQHMSVQCRECVVARSEVTLSCRLVCQGGSPVSAVACQRARLLRKAAAAGCGLRHRQQPRSIRRQRKRAEHDLRQIRTSCEPI
jgi:hypothetical protein